jgi:intraflagellar transport protein 80
MGTFDSFYKLLGINLTEYFNYFNIYFRFIALLDAAKGVLIYNYDGKFISTPKLAGLRPEFCNERTVSISPDTIAIRDHSDEKAIYLFDTLTGKPIGEQPAFRHVREISHLALDHGTDVSRQLAFIDKNQDLYLINGLFSLVSQQKSALPVSVASNGSQANNSVAVKKLAAMADSLKWNEESHILCAVVDSKVSIWYYPQAPFVDPDISDYTRTTVDVASSIRQGTILLFVGSQCLIRASDGSVLNVHGVDPFPVALFNLMRRKRVEDAVKLCRFVRSKLLWSCLALVAVAINDLNTAEVAYASIDDVKKVQFINHLKEIKSADLRKAKLALFQHQIREAEAIMLAGNYVFNCIKMYLELFRFDRALEISSRYKSYSDVVMFYRRKYLSDLGMSETNEEFLKLSDTV